MRKLLKIIWRTLTAPFRFVAWLFRLVARWLSQLFKEIRSLLLDEPEDEPLPDTLAKTIEHPAGLLEHVDALRKHLFRALVILIITTAIAFTFTQRLIDLLARPIGGIGELTPIEVTEPIAVFMRVALLAGFAVALPYIAFELWLFAAPGLHRRSRLMGLIAIPLVVIFFVGGMAFAYFAMLPTALPFLLNFMGMNPQVRPASYITFVTGLLFWIGVAFEFPLVIYVLADMGIVKSRLLIEQWRLAMVFIAVLAAAITPTVDPVNMSLVMGPMIVLYFLSIGLASLAQRNRADRE
ncbi:MAG: twin-arginine translocase subunit TatC [Chloroflexi bacterium]|nr:twin-arginine translocase subunit TatC [Chloroflexota bacterium]